jgi:hypothetical protein
LVLISGLVSKIFSLSLAVLVIGVNIYFVFQYVVGLNITAWYFITGIIVVGVAYLLLCLYLIVDMIITMGGERLATFPIVQSLFSPPVLNYNEMRDP